MLRQTYLFMALALVACSGESGSDAAHEPGPNDAGSETSISEDGSDSADVVTEDAPAETFGVPFCTELGVDNVLPTTTSIANDFAKLVFDDCRVIQLVLALTPEQGSAWIQSTASWTGAFFGCPASGDAPTSFGPVDTGQSPAMSQSDVDVLVEHFAVAVEQSLTLSAPQSQALRDELAAVGALSVNVPIPEHALSLCTDAGVPDAGTDAEAGP